MAVLAKFSTDPSQDVDCLHELKGKHFRKNAVGVAQDSNTRKRRKAALSGSLWLEALLSKLENGIHLIPSNPGEPFEEILNTRAILQVLKKSSNRHTAPFEDPRPAYLAGLSFDFRTPAPIHH